MIFSRTLPGLAAAGPIVLLLLTLSGCQQSDSDRLALAVERGDQALQSGSWDRAALEYSDAIRLAPREARYYVGRGRAYLGQGHWQESIADFTRAAEIAPDDADLLYRRALAYEKLGLADEAAADRAHARSLDPKVAEAYRRMPWDYYDRTSGMPTAAPESSAPASALAETAAGAERRGLESRPTETEILPTPTAGVAANGDATAGGTTVGDRGQRKLTITEQLLGGDDLADSPFNPTSPDLRGDQRPRPVAPRSLAEADLPAPHRPERRVNARIPNLFAANARLPQASLAGQRPTGPARTNQVRALNQPPGLAAAPAAGDALHAPSAANEAGLDQRRATTVRFVPGATGFDGAAVAAAAHEAALIRERHTVRIAPPNYAARARFAAGVGALATPERSAERAEAPPWNSGPLPPGGFVPLDNDRFGR